MKIHDESKAFKCDVCFKSCLSKSQLKTHYRTHTGEKPFGCQVCDKKFSQKFQLLRHQVIHSEVRSFKCSICPEGRSFKTKDGLRNHLKYHYEPKFCCSHCDHKSYTTYDLKKHINAQHKI